MHCCPLNPSQDQQTPDLSIPNRFITDHNASGLSVFNTSIPDALPTQIVGERSKFLLGYATSSIPADFTGQFDISTYSSFLSTPPGVFLPGGTVLRIVDMQPGGGGPMHRTHSLDYGVVLDGEIELVLDSLDSRTLKRSDVVVQRGTNHLWKNKSQTEWARMLFVTMESKPVEVDGKVLSETDPLGVESATPTE
ncbi:hypothetical protein Daus18300_012244 [Diaporthe australafricana]|uniref:Cupin type-2 domain-containing protein n=1 Tax=Diaporthe australafricana TaxID=127596 RepID=A0ABR3W3Q3_9PEZI